MIKVILVTIVFTFGGGTVKMTTKVPTMDECHAIIHNIVTTVGVDNVQVKTCEEVSE